MQVSQTYILVGNDLNTRDVTSGTEDLAQDVFGDALIQASDIECTLVRLGRRSSYSATCTHRASQSGTARGHGRVWSVGVDGCQWWSLGKGMVHVGSS